MSDAISLFFQFVVLAVIAFGLFAAVRWRFVFTNVGAMMTLVVVLSIPLLILRLSLTLDDRELPEALFRAAGALAIFDCVWFLLLFSGRRILVRGSSLPAPD